MFGHWNYLQLKTTHGGFETLLAAAVTTVMNGQNELTITMCGVKSVVEDREASVWESLFFKIIF